MRLLLVRRFYIEKSFTEATFDSEALKAKVAFVDFYADWCGPCQAMGPVVEKLADEYEGKAVIGKVNVDENPELARRYRVMTIPCMMVFKNGEITKKFIGTTAESELKAAIDEALA